MSPFTGTANPEQLAIMSEAFEQHCLLHGIVDETDDLGDSALAEVALVTPGFKPATRAVGQLF